MCGVNAGRKEDRTAESLNDVWCRDFIFDRTPSGGQINWLPVIDQFTRE
jgi:transposase InsO family protein